MRSIFNFMRFASYPFICAKEGLIKLKVNLMKSNLLEYMPILMKVVRKYPRWLMASKKRPKQLKTILWCPCCYRKWLEELKSI